jgi:hypothetical protein
MLAGAYIAGKKKGFKSAVVEMILRHVGIKVSDIYPRFKEAERDIFFVVGEDVTKLLYSKLFSGESYIKESKRRIYTEKEKKEAVECFFANNCSPRIVAQKLGYPSKNYLLEWIKQDPRYDKEIHANRRGILTDEVTDDLQKKT